MTTTSLETPYRLRYTIKGAKFTYHGTASECRVRKEVLEANDVSPVIMEVDPARGKAQAKALREAAKKLKASASAVRVNRPRNP